MRPRSSEGGESEPQVLDTFTDVMDVISDSVVEQIKTLRIGISMGELTAEDNQKMQQLAEQIQDELANKKKSYAGNIEDEIRAIIFRQDQAA